MAKRDRTGVVEETRDPLGARIRLAREQYARILQRAATRRVHHMEIGASKLVATRKRTSVRNRAKLVESPLVLLAMEEDFGLEILKNQRTLSCDFELAV